MDTNQIAKELERQAEQWEKILNYKTKSNDKGLADAIRKGKPDPKSKSRSKIIHPGKHILELLDKAYHHSEFSLQLDKRCNELYQEVTESIPKWPSLEWGGDYKLPVIGHIYDFAALLSKISSNGKKVPQNNEAYIPFRIALSRSNGILTEKVLYKAVKEGKPIKVRSTKPSKQRLNVHIQDVLRLTKIVSSNEDVEEKAAKMLGEYLAIHQKKMSSCQPNLD